MSAEEQPPVKDKGDYEEQSLNFLGAKGPVVSLKKQKQQHLANMVPEDLAEHSSEQKNVKLAAHSGLSYINKCE